MLGVDVLGLLGSVLGPGLRPCEEGSVLERAGCTYIGLGVATSCAACGRARGSASIRVNDRLARVCNI